MDLLKDFVPSKESFELKELGFDEPCLLFVNHNGEVVRYMNPDKDWNSVTKQTLKNSDITLPETCTLPTLTQAFRWITTRYGYHYYVTNNVDFVNEMNDLESWYYVILTNELLSGDIESEEYFTTKDIAELKCLQNLIEIIKLKNKK